MSASVYYSTQRKGNYVKGDVHEYIKHKLQEVSISECNVAVNGQFYNYILGLRDAKVTGAEEIIKYIEEHGEIVIWLEY